MLPIAEMARRFDLTKVGHSASVFDVGKLCVDEPPLHEGRAGVAASLATRSSTSCGSGTSPHGTDASLGYLESILGMAVGSVDRLEEIPERVSFIFDWAAARAAALVAAEPDGARAVGAHSPTRSRRSGRSIATRFARRPPARARRRDSRDARCSIRFASRSRPPSRGPSSIWRFRRSIGARRSRPGPGCRRSSRAGSARGWPLHGIGAMRNGACQ